MNRQELFDALINKCNILIEKSSTPCNLLNGRITNTKEFLKYEDDVFRFVKDPATLELVIIKKENNNPVLCRDKDGKIYRVNGEIQHIKDHILNL